MSDLAIKKLLVAAGSGNLDKVKELLQTVKGPNVSNEFGYTALMSASGSYRIDVIRFLLEVGADPLVKSRDGITALHAAVGSSPSLPETQRESVTLLLEAGAEVDARTNTGVTPLMNAAWFGCELAIVELLRYSPNLSLVNEEGKTAVHLARQRKHSSIVTILSEQENAQ